MSKTPISSAAFGDTKPHYMILDGLRGVAAIMVVWFHIFEAYATSHLDQKINHGYLAAVPQRRNVTIPRKKIHRYRKSISDAPISPYSSTIKAYAKSE